MSELTGHALSILVPQVDDSAGRADTSVRFCDDCPWVQAAAVSQPLLRVVIFFLV